MRVFSSRVITVIAIISGGISVSHADDQHLSSCLQSSAYLDAVQTIDACAPLLEKDDLSAKDLAAVSLQVGEALYFYGEAGRALPYLNAAITLDPTEQAYRRRGWSQSHLGNISAAIDDFSQALEIKPDNPDAEFAIAYVRGSAVDCGARAKAFEGILARHPDHYLARLSLAAMYHCIDGHQSRQIVELTRILSAGRETIADTPYYGRGGRSGPDFYAFVLQIRAEAFYFREQATEALADFTWLIENYPSLPIPYERRARLRLNVGDTGGALADADRLVQLAPDYPDGQLTRMLVLNQLKRDSDSIAFANDILARGYVSDRTPEIYLYRAIALKRLGRKQEALADFQRAMAQSDWSLWMVHSQLSQAGYLFGPIQIRSRGDGGPPLDPNAKEFANALAACLIDPECMK